MSNSKAKKKVDENKQTDKALLAVGIIVAVFILFMIASGYIVVNECAPADDLATPGIPGVPDVCVKLTLRKVLFGF